MTRSDGVTEVTEVTVIAITNTDACCVKVKGSAEREKNEMVAQTAVDSQYTISPKISTTSMLP